MKNKFFSLILSCIIAQSSVHAMEIYPLHDAVKRGDEAQVAALLASSADVNQQEACGWTPLHIVAITGQLTVAQLLLDHGANVDKQNNGEGERCLGLLVFHDHPYTYGYTLPYTQTYSVGSTPLHLAIDNDHPSVVQLLLIRRANANHRDRNGTTPLHFAALKGCKASAEHLLDHGADVDAQGIKHSTPLHWATGRGHLEMTQLLLSRGAAVNLQNDEGFTPLHKATINAHTAIVQLLLNHGNVRVSVQDTRGFTQLQSATHYGNGTEGYQIAGALIKSYMEHARIECPVCLQSVADITTTDHAATPCCQQFICRTDLARVKAAGQSCPLCRSSVGWGQEEDEDWSDMDI